MDQDLDAGLVLVVAAPVPVVDPENRLKIIEQFVTREEVAHGLADHRRATKSAAYDDAVAHLARIVLHDADADVVDIHRGAVFFGARNGDFELARQIFEFRMQSGPLTDQLGRGTRIFDFIGCHACQMVGGDVAYAIARGLDGMHFDIGQHAQQIRHIDQLQPVVLQVLPGGEMGIAAIVFVGDGGQLPHLRGTQRAIRNGNAKHVSMKLQIKAVHEPQRLELVLAQRPVDAPRHLATELLDPLANQRLVEFIIAIHQALSPKAIVGPAARIASR